MSYDKFRGHKCFIHAGSWGSYLNSRLNDLVFKHRPKEPGKKQTCVIVILAYFTKFQSKPY